MKNKTATIWVSSGFTAYHYHGGALNEEKHSHDFKYKIFLKGPLNEEGFLVDFREVENLLKQINARLENKVLNEKIDFLQDLQDVNDEDIEYLEDLYNKFMESDNLTLINSDLLDDMEELD